MSDERFTIKPQDDYWAVVDNYNEDKVCIINGIHTEIEAIWLCDFMNEQQSTIERLKKDNEKLQKENNNLTNNIKDMVGHLRMEYNHASSQRSKYVDDVYVEKAYNIVRLSIYRALRILGCDE